MVDAKLLTGLGYRLARRDGHAEVWYHPGFPGPFVQSKTPSDWRASRNALALLRRRHPELRPEKHAGPRRRRKPKPERKQPGVRWLIGEPRGDGREWSSSPRWWRLRCMGCGRPHNHQGLRPLKVCSGCGGSDIREREGP